jgi:hypothetical protein
MQDPQESSGSCGFFLVLADPVLWLAIFCFAVLQRAAAPFGTVVLLLCKN